MRELSRLAEKARKAAAIGGAPGVQLDAERAWARAQKAVDEFCRTVRRLTSTLFLRLLFSYIQASTYLSFMTSPFSSRASPDHQTIQTLLNAISTHIVGLLSLIPASTNPPASAQLLLQLGKTIVSQWSTWLDALSTDINQKGGMLPHSIVSPWTESLDILADPPSSPVWSQPQSTISWGFSTPTVASNTPHPLVDSFRSAMQPIGGETSGYSWCGAGECSANVPSHCFTLGHIGALSMTEGLATVRV
jgi:hypothetical protein